MDKMDGMELMKQLRSQADAAGGTYNVRFWHTTHNRRVGKKGGVSFYAKTSRET